MQLLYEEELVEGAVFLCANGRRSCIPPLQASRFSRSRERLYDIPDPDARNNAFFALHLKWFREWGLADLLAGVIREYPILDGALKTLSFRRAKARNEEGAELFVHPEEGRNGVVALRIERFERDADLLPFLLHELMHLSDMTDPAFGYSRDVPVRNPSQQQLVLGRYRLLWDITIDARLSSRTPKPTEPASRASSELKNRYETEFNRAYCFWDEARRREVFEALWNDAAPRHERLMSLAVDPRGAAAMNRPEPGGLCPLCGFSTFDWADGAAICSETAEAIRRQFPSWAVTQGACNRCVEVYEASQLEQPATLFL
ncbi:MAG: hypothetical protein HY360_23165 [Verrucomicrobia bacterium]|nr:hypothetical protein [Verrucomicrobiota bacterium]